MLGQAALLVVAFAAYKWVRTLIVGHEDLARVHAGQVHRFEAWLHLPPESWLQSTIPSGDVFRALTTYDTSVHFPLMAAFVIVGLVFRPVGQYVWRGPCC